MGTTSRGSAGRHRRGVRAIGVITLITLAASLLPLGVALAEPPAQAGSPGKPETQPEAELLAQAITFTLPASAIVGESLALEGSADSGLLLDYRSETPRTCSIHQAVLELKSGGTCTVSASQAGDDRYAGTTDVTASIEVVAPPVAEPPADAEPPGQAEERVKPEPPGQAEERTRPEPPGQAEEKARPEPPGQAEEKTAEDRRSISQPERLLAPAPSAGRPTLVIYGNFQAEGDVGTREFQFSAVLLAPSSADVTFNYATADDTATAPSDYIAESGSLTIPAGNTELQFFVTVNGDEEVEPDERFDIVISRVVGATYDPGNSSPFGSIDNDDYDTPPTLSIDPSGPQDLYEQNYPHPANQRTFEAVLSHPWETDVTFEYATADDTATAPSDYIAETGSVTIPAGEWAASFSFTVNGDYEIELDERFEVVISNVGGATYNAAASDPYGWILNDDAPPELRVWSDDWWTEGDSPDREANLYHYYLTHPATVDVSFDYTTVDDTATAPSDYIAKSGTVTIPVGQTQGDIRIVFNGDTVIEPDERLLLEISNVVGATFDPSANDLDGWIRDDDAPSYTVVAESVAEGDSGTRELAFSVDLSWPHIVDVSMDYEASGGWSGGSATAGSDYLAESGTITIPAGQTHAEFSITVIGDTEVEPDENLVVIPRNDELYYDYSASDASGWIVNDDGPHTLYLDSYELDEGDSGTSELTFEAWLSIPSATDVTFHYATTDDTATAPSDYVAESGTVTIPAGETYAEFSVTVKGDTEVEFDEWFELLVSNVAGATYDADLSYPWGDILNDDLPTLSVDDVTIIEGTGADTVATFTVSLSAPISDHVWVSLRTADGSAVSPADYEGGGLYLHAAPGQIGWHILVTIIGDGLDEPDETFSLVLSNPINATIADGTGLGTIVDDDAPAPVDAPALVEPAPAPTAPPADTAPPAVTAPTAGFLTGTAIGSGATPLPLRVAFSASDPSGLASTALQHRIGAGAFTGVALASGTATSATVPVGTSAKTVHQFQARATDGAGNASPFAVGPAFRVEVVQDGASAIRAKGTWAAKNTRSAFGGSVRQASKADASQSWTVTASDLAIVSARGKDRGKVRVMLDGKAVASLDLYAKATMAKQVIYTVSFPSAGKHTIALVALGKKNPKATGTRVDLDAFLALTP